jgi:hypothetical protein
VQPTEPDSAAAELARLRADVVRHAHDLGNALGAVLNYATFLCEDLQGIEAAAAGPALSYLPHLEQAAQRAAQLVEQLNRLAGSAPPGRPEGNGP